MGVVAPPPFLPDLIEYIYRRCVERAMRRIDRWYRDNREELEAWLHTYERVLREAAAKTIQEWVYEKIDVPVNTRIEMLWKAEIELRKYYQAMGSSPATMQRLEQYLDEWRRMEIEKYTEWAYSTRMKIYDAVSEWFAGRLNGARMEYDNMMRELNFRRDEAIKAIDQHCRLLGTPLPLADILLPAIQPEPLPVQPEILPMPPAVEPSPPFPPNGAVPTIPA